MPGARMPYVAYGIPPRPSYHGPVNVYAHPPSPALQTPTSPLTAWRQAFIPHQQMPVMNHPPLHVSAHSLLVQEQSISQSIESFETDLYSTVCRKRIRGTDSMLLFILLLVGRPSSKSRARRSIFCWNSRSSLAWHVLLTLLQLDCHCYRTKSKSSDLNYYETSQWQMKSIRLRFSCSKFKCRPAKQKPKILFILLFKKNNNMVVTVSVFNHYSFCYYLYHCIVVASMQLECHHLTLWAWCRHHRHRIHTSKSRHYRSTNTMHRPLHHYVPHRLYHRTAMPRHQVTTTFPWWVTSARIQLTFRTLSSSRSHNHLRVIPVFMTRGSVRQPHWQVQY